MSRHSTTETRIVGAENRVPSERTKRTVSTVFYKLIEYRHEVTDRSWTVNRVKFGGGVIEALANSPPRDEMDDADEKEENEAEAPWLASQGD